MEIFRKERKGTVWLLDNCRIKFYKGIFFHSLIMKTNLMQFNLQFDKNNEKLKLKIEIISANQKLKELSDYEASKKNFNILRVIIFER
jgi:hypothetical protein